MKTTGLIVDVYRNSSADCTANGISSNQNTLILIDIDAPFEGDEKNSVKLVTRWLFGKWYHHAEPLVKPEGMVGPMMGGNFIYTSDSRFPSDYPIPLHDRFETQEAYKHLST